MNEANIEKDTVVISQVRKSTGNILFFFGVLLCVVSFLGLFPALKIIFPIFSGKPPVNAGLGVLFWLPMPIAGIIGLVLVQIGAIANRELKKKVKRWTVWTLISLVIVGAALFLPGG